MPNISIEVIKEELIPERIREAYLTQKRRREYPKSYFLLVDADGNRKFPWKDPDTGKPHCGLLRAAMSRAGQYGYSQVLSSAQSKYDRYCKQKQNDRPRIFKEDYSIKLLKEDSFDGYVTGIVAEPDEVDAHGDVLTKEAIREAAYKYMENFQAIKYRHGRVLSKDQVALVESWIAPISFSVNGQEVKEGSWLQTLHIKDEGLKKEVLEGRLTGFSLGGWVEAYE